MIIVMQSACANCESINTKEGITLAARILAAFPGVSLHSPVISQLACFCWASVFRARIANLDLLRGDFATSWKILRVDYRFEFRDTACPARRVGAAVPADVYISIPERMGKRHIVEAKERKSWDLWEGCRGSRVATFLGSGLDLSIRLLKCLRSSLFIV